MSSRKSKQDLNISGLSPLVLNILSPKSSNNSPAKNYAILESINSGKDALISGYGKWKTAESNGYSCINSIHNMKEKSRLSSDSQYVSELESFCRKLKAIESVFQSTIIQVTTLKDQMRSSLNILAAMGDKDEELNNKISTIERFLTKLQSLYDSDLKSKQFVIENIAHTSTSEESQELIVRWTCGASSTQISRLIMQLKNSPESYRWNN